MQSTVRRVKKRTSSIIYIERLRVLLCRVDEVMKRLPSVGGTATSSLDHKNKKFLSRE